jgi:hydrogenase maturation factor
VKTRDISVLQDVLRGGLLIAVKAGDAELLVTDLKGEGIKDASIIGEFVESPKGKIVIQD